MKFKTATLLLIITFTLFGGLITALTSYSLSNSYKIQSSWYSFQSSHLHKGRALSALYGEIGYGGMIHNFKNYLLRQNLNNADAVKSRLGGAKAAIVFYRSLGLNKFEHEALDKITKNLVAYEHALDVISLLIEKNKSVSEIDQFVKIDDRPALDGLSTLLAETKSPLHNVSADLHRSEVIGNIRRAMGFGGMIHLFKNGILRKDQNIISQAKLAFSAANQAVLLYLSFELSSNELNAIRRIQAVLLNYKLKMDEVEKLDLKKFTPEHLDRLVQVNDIPALEGLAVLDNEIVLHGHQAEENLSATLNTIIDSEKITLILTLLAFVILVSGWYWLIRFQIIKPIKLLTNTMMDISNNKLDIDVIGVDKNTEIGEMARAIQVFRDNTILLARTKEALAVANKGLEHQVVSRTKALKHSEGLSRSILKTAVDAIITIDGRGNIVSFNKAAENMFGYTHNELKGKDLGILMPGSLKQRHDLHVKKYLETGETTAIGSIREMEACRKNGDKFPIQVSVGELVSTEGILFTGIIRDITELKEYQKKLQLSKKEADKANEAKSIFVANMNHELRTPMNAIMGFSQLLECNAKEPLTMAQKEATTAIRAAGDHLLNIINQILELDQIEAGKKPIVLAKTAPAKLIKESIAVVVQAATESNIEFIDNIKYYALPDITTDGVRLKQILINLLSNAIKYNKPGGKVILDATFASMADNEKIDNKNLGNEKIRFSVTDTGKGIAQSRQPQIFMPFERLGHESGSIEGTGIGLSITKNIVELMNGEIGFESEEGQGSCFWFELPLSN